MTRRTGTLHTLEEPSTPYTARAEALRLQASSDGVVCPCTVRVRDAEVK
ncbi:MAG: hypothetical protein M3014_12230 [Chloroflexota bacterium]|nr:hypothetical protein [Chloroflexota bacterium]